MEKTNQKSKKEKPNNYLEKEKSSSFISDVKAFKENLKIREILKTVKMNSSMRIKAPRGSKVMQNKDFNDNEDIYAGVVAGEGQQVEEPPSATNTVLNREKESEIVHEESIEEEEFQTTLSENKTDNASSVFLKSKSMSEGIDDCSKDDVIQNTLEYPLRLAERAGAKSRDRKLSLDQTMLLRREGLSQSEVDLNSIGKSPLERKSSFFRKKMDSFVRNTTEIFKRQSMSSKSTRSPVTARRDSTSSRMSVSLQSLNEDSTCFEEFKNVPLNTYRDQQSSVSSLATPRTDSTVSITLEQGEVYTVADSLSPEDQLAPSTSTHSLNKEPIQDSLLNTRAISMSSGLNTATGQRRRKTSRSNRVSWLASESLTDYFRRLIQDEKSKEIPQGWQSHQDFSTIPENRVGSKIDSKGRRLSYMRAVSGEDPSQASSFRKKKHMESEIPRPSSKLDEVLARYAEYGIPRLGHYTPYVMPDEARRFVMELNTEEGFDNHFPIPNDPSIVLDTFNNNSDNLQRDTVQAILRELVVSETQFIKHLDSIVNVYLATAHALQSEGFLPYANSYMLFSRIPDIFNSAMSFFVLTIYPMLQSARNNGSLLDPRLIIPGLMRFPSILEYYEDYLKDQATAINYLRHMNTDPDFRSYINWCNRQANTRLQLADVLIKPMQRLTKYSLIIERLLENITDPPTINELRPVLELVKSYIAGVNRAVRQKEEDEKLDGMRIDSYDPEYKGDEDVENVFKQLAIVNLHVPMIDCGTVGRCLIHSGVMRFKDSNLKEFDVHVLLFTDMMLICKNQPKMKEKGKEKPKEHTIWKMIRPKIMLSRLRPAKKTEVSTLPYIILDELGSSQSVFQLSEAKDGLDTLKVWECKILEAMYSNALTKWYVLHPPLDEGDVEASCSLKESEQKHYIAPETKTSQFRQQRLSAAKEVEKRARERVAAMLHRKGSNNQTIQRKIDMAELQVNLVQLYDEDYPESYENDDIDFFSEIKDSISVTRARMGRHEDETEASSSTDVDSPKDTLTWDLPSDNVKAGSLEPGPSHMGQTGSPEAGPSHKGQTGSPEPGPSHKGQTGSPEPGPSHKGQTGARAVSPRRRPSMAIAIASGIPEANSEKASPITSSSNITPVNSGPDILEIFERGIANCIAEPLPSTAQNMILSSLGSNEEPELNQMQLTCSALDGSFVVGDGGRRSPGMIHTQTLYIPETTQTQLPSPRSARAPTLVLQKPSPNHSPGPRSASACGSGDNMLLVASPGTLVHSMPDIKSELHRVPSLNLEPKPVSLTASERLYRSHQELMHRNRLAGRHHYLKSSHRGSSYPPPSPRALQRGDAVSFSFRHPPLTRTTHLPERLIVSQPDTPRRIFGRRSAQSDLATGAKSPRRQRSSSPIPRAVRPPEKKAEKKKSLFMRRSKASQKTPENFEYDADDDGSQRSNQEKRKQRDERSIGEDASSSTTDDQDDLESSDSPKNGGKKK